MNEPLPPELAARYEVLAVLGEGSFGQVLLVEDRRLGRRVALKRLHGTLDDPALRARFEREARLTARLAHPHVVGVHDFGVAADGSPFIVYEYVAGIALDGARGLSARRVEAVLLQVAGALHAAHEVGIVHRDVKPGNVLLREHGDAVLCDLGLAREQDGRTALTTEGLLLGTASYMAPELWEGRPPSAASDQFALAATAWSVLTGEGVYGAEGPAAIADRLRQGWSPPVDRRVPEGLGQVLRRALAPRPEERFPDCAAMAAALREPATEEESVRTYALPRPGAARPPGARAPASPVERRPAGPPTSRQGKPPGGAAPPTLLAVVALVLFLGALLLAGGEPEPPPSPPPAAPARPDSLTPFFTRLCGAVDTLEASLEGTGVPWPRFGDLERLPRLLPVTGAPEFLGEYRDLVIAYRDLLVVRAGKSPASDPEAERLLERSRGRIVAVLAHARTLARSPLRVLSEEAGDRDPALLRARGQDLQGTVQMILPAFFEALGRLRLEQEVGLVQLAALADDERDEAWTRRAAEDAAVRPPAAGDGFSLLRLARVLYEELPEEEPDCSARWAATEALLRAISRSPEGGESLAEESTRLLAVAHVLRAAEETGRVCRSPGALPGGLLEGAADFLARRLEGLAFLPAETPGLKLLYRLEELRVRGGVPGVALPLDRLGEIATPLRRAWMEAAGRAVLPGASPARRRLAAADRALGILLGVEDEDDWESLGETSNGARRLIRSWTSPDFGHAWEELLAAWNAWLGTVPPPPSDEAVPGGPGSVRAVHAEVLGHVVGALDRGRELADDLGDDLAFYLLEERSDPELMERFRAATEAQRARARSFVDAWRARTPGAPWLARLRRALGDEPEDGSPRVH